MGIVKSGGEWQITLKSTINMRELVDNGIEIDGKDIPVRCLTRNIIVVSFFGVPVYVDNNMLTAKLDEFDVKQISSWTRKCYRDYPDIESGIVFCRIELPEHVRSLPYATRIAEVNIQIKHNGQLKVCNYCLSEEHLMRSCPDRRKCYICNLPGHIARDCPDKTDEGDDDNNDDDDEVDQETMSGQSDQDAGQADSKADALEETDAELVIDETVPMKDAEPTRKRPAAVSEDDGENTDPDWVVALKSKQSTSELFPAGWVPAKTRHNSRKKRVSSMKFPKHDTIELRNKYDELSSGDDSVDI